MYAVLRNGFANEAQAGQGACASSRAHRDLVVVIRLDVVIPATFTMHKWGSADG